MSGVERLFELNLYSELLSLSGLSLLLAQVFNADGVLCRISGVARMSDVALSWTPLWYWFLKMCSTDNNRAAGRSHL